MAQGLPYCHFLRRFIGLQLFWCNAVGQVCGNQPLVTRAQTGESGECSLAGQLVADKPGCAGGDVAGRQSGEPEVKIAVERFFREGGNFRWQTQRFNIAAGQRLFFPAAGNAL